MKRGVLPIATALALVALPTSLNPHALAAAPVPVETAFAPVNGIQLFFRIYGHGAPVLMIHGGLSDSRVWQAQIQTLSEDHEVIIADSRGQGRSTRTNDPITYDLMADDYLKLLDALGIEQTALVGWSDGGIIGLDLAIHHPERLSRIFIQAANASPDGFKHYRPPASVPELRHYDSISDEIEALWANEPNFTPEELASISVPTEIVIGEHDEAISRRHTEYLAETIPGAKLLILPDVGHSAPLEDPEGYSMAVLAFLDEDTARAELTPASSSAHPPSAASR